MKKDSMNEAVVNSINWELIEAAMTESKRSRRVFISKQTSMMCGVGKFMKRWKMRQDDNCPRCGIQEDSINVWTCHGEGADDICDRAITNLDSWFNLNQTDPDIQHLIISYLKSWRANDKETTHSTFLLEEIIQGQLKVRWRRFLRAGYLEDGL